MLSHDEVLDVLEDSWNYGHPWADILPNCTVEYLDDYSFRDRLLVRWAKDGAPLTLIDTLEDVLGYPAYTVSAIAYWIHGDTDMALAHTEIAAWDGYRLAALVQACIHSGITGDRWLGTLLSTVTEEDCCR